MDHAQTPSKPCDGYAVVNERGKNVPIRPTLLIDSLPFAPGTRVYNWGGVWISNGVNTTRPQSSRFMASNHSGGNAWLSGSSNQRTDERSRLPGCQAWLGYFRHILLSLSWLCSPPCDAHTTLLLLLPHKSHSRLTARARRGRGPSCSFRGSSS